MGIFYHPPAPHIGGRQPLEPKKLPPSITAVPENNPPFGLRQALWPIIRSWQPEPPIFRKQIVFPEGVLVDDPPFSQRDSMRMILESWQQEPPIFRKQITSPQEEAAAAAVNDDWLLRFRRRRRTRR